MNGAPTGPIPGSTQNEARREAIRLSKEKLALATAGDGFERRCLRLGLPPPSDGAVEFPFFDTRARLDLESLEVAGPGGADLSLAERILLYHYLNYDGELPAGGEPISFREFPGGAFYWEPFRSRTCVPLAERYGQEPGAVRAALSRYEWKELGFGDFSAHVRGFGRLGLVLVFNADQEAMGPEVNALFDPAVRRAYAAEDAVAFASRICLSLLPKENAAPR